MGKLFDFLTGDWVGWLASFAGLAAIVAAIWFGFHSWTESLRQEGRDEIQLIRKQENAERKAVADQAALVNRAEELRRRADQQRTIDDANRKTEQALADAGAARDAAGRLQQRAALVAARCRQAGGDPGSGSASAPAADPAGMLADVLGQLDARAGRLAEYADRARTAGETCEQSYDSLKAGGQRPVVAEH